ncbi:tyrosine-type recombinase/integrase [Lachnospiraceae bacterium 29-84]
MPKDLKGRELPTGIYQRKDGRYEARAVIKGIKIQLYNFNLKELKVEFEKRKEEARQGVDKKLSEITLDEWFEEWFTRYKLPKIKETSISPMKTKYRANFGRLLGGMKVSEIRNMDIQDVINTMHKEGKAVSSMRDALGRVRECLECAKNNRIISENPCFDIMVPWENVTRERRFLSQEEQNRFLQQVEDNWYKEMFYIMFLTGMRIGEVGGLKWEDVDFKNKCINISRSLSCQYESGVKTVRLTTPKTRNSYRRIPFMGEAEDMLLSQRKKQDKIKKELGARYRSNGDFSDLVFVTSMGSPVFRHHAEKEVKKIVKAINEQEAFDSVREQREPHYFEDLYPHAIRHTFCSRCFQLDMNPKVVQKLMGHQHYSTTIDIYTHVMQDDIDREVRKLESAVIMKPRE